jgi:hypothetical protein
VSPLPKLIGGSGQENSQIVFCEANEAHKRLTLCGQTKNNLTLMQEVDRVSSIHVRLTLK